MIAENPLQLLKSAEGIQDFSGKNPKNYTYEDLVIELDGDVVVAKEMKNLTFKSAIYRIAQVLDENDQPLKTTASFPQSDELVTTFSFENPNQVKKFIIRAVLRNYGTTDNPNNIVAGSTVWNATADEIIGNMVISSGDKENITIPKAKALEYSKAKKHFEFNGSINGSIASNTSQLNFLYALFVKKNYIIKETKALNKILIGFVFNQVNYNRNSLAFENDVEQDLGKSLVVHNYGLNSDELKTNTLPSKTQDGDTHLPKLEDVLIGNDYYAFVEWNTASDGTGLKIDENTVITNDVTAYAIWNKKQASSLIPLAPATPIIEKKPPVIPTPPVVTPQISQPKVESLPPASEKTKDSIETGDYSFVFVGLLIVSMIGLVKLNKKL